MFVEISKFEKRMDGIDSELIFEGHELGWWVRDTKPATDRKYFTVLGTEPDPEYVKMVAEPLENDNMNKVMSAAEEREEKNKKLQDSITHKSAGMGHPKPNFCSNCQKHGHEDAHCREIFPDEEHPNYCDVWKIDRHW